MPCKRRSWKARRPKLRVSCYKGTVYVVKSARPKRTLKVFRSRGAAQDYVKSKKKTGLVS